MKIKKINNLAISNIKLAVKMICLQIILFGFLTAIVVFALNLSLADLSAMFDSELYDAPKRAIDGLISGQYDVALFFDDFVSFINDVLDTFRTDAPLFNEFVDVIGIMFAVLMAVMFLGYVILGLTEFPGSQCLNDFMTSGVQKPFLWQFFKSIRKSFRFCLLKAVCFVVFDVVILCLTTGVYILFLLSLKLVGVIIAIVLLIVMHSIRLTLFAFWAPALCVEGVGVNKARRISLKKLVDKAGYVFLYALIVATVVCVLICAFYYLLGGYVGAIMMPVLLFLGSYKLSCVNMVLYYEADKKTFFTKRLDMVAANEE